MAAEAEAEAAEAEALAAAARARARAIRLRREAQAQAVQSSPGDEATDTQVPAADTASAEVTATSTASTDTATSAEPTDEDVINIGPAPRPAEFKRRMQPRSATAAVVATATLTLGLLGVSAYLVWHHDQVIERRQQDAAFLSAARQGIVNMTSFDFNRAKEDVQRVIDGSTGEFRDDFQKRAADFTTVVQQSKVVTQGSVAAAAIESVRGDSAVVLVLASERVTNAAGAKDEPREFRLRVTVSPDGDQLKMSKVEFVL
jgi:Mce-associated membrane protein